MALNHFGYIISIVILISGLVGPDSVSLANCIDSTEFECQNSKVYNPFCNSQNCAEPCEKRYVGKHCN